MKRFLLLLSSFILFGNLFHVYATEMQDTKFLKTTYEYQNEQLLNLHKNLFLNIFKYLQHNEILSFIEIVLSKNAPSSISEQENINQFIQTFSFTHNEETISSENANQFIQKLTDESENQIVKFQQKFENLLLKFFHFSSLSFISLQEPDKDKFILYFLNEDLKNFKIFRSDGIWIQQGVQGTQKATNNLYIVDLNGIMKIFEKFPEKIENIVSKTIKSEYDFEFRTNENDFITYTEGFNNKYQLQGYFPKLYANGTAFALWPDSRFVKKLNDKLWAEKLTCQKYFNLEKGKGKLFLTNKNTLMYTENYSEFMPWGIIGKPSDTLDPQLYEIENVKIIDLREEDGHIFLEDGSEFQFVKEKYYPPDVTVVSVAIDGYIWGYLKRISSATKTTVQELENEMNKLM